MSKRLSDADKAEIYRLLRAGEKQCDVAGHFGVSDSTISRVIQCYVQEQKRPPQIWMTDEQIENLYRAAAYTKAQIDRLAQLNGVPPRVIRRILCERGVLRDE